MHTELNWLETIALPIWWSAGADHIRGGFHELLDAQGGTPLVPRRARVIGRQVYVYATAAASGIEGPWLAAAKHGVDFMVGKFLRPDGLITPTLSSDGQPLAGEPKLYDQAFCLFALAAAAHAGIDPMAQAGRAEQLLATLDREWRLPAGGFIEHEAEAYQSNPHMHLFEASLAWEAAGGGARWTALADEIGELALSRFIDPVGGFLREFFDAEWRPAAMDAGRIVEPGHQFEWAWLMARWGKLRGRADAIAAARQLHNIGYTRGIDWNRGVAIDQLNDDMTIRSPQARLWPQTERIKAAAILAEMSQTPQERDFYGAEVAAGAKGLELYLQTPIPGLWRDKMLPDGSFVEEPSPASSLYHIACAIWDAKARGFDI